jgi:hypothetical protein
MAPAKGPLGTVLTGIAQWQPQNAFINQFKSARQWIPQKEGVFDTGAAIDLDDKGWVRSIPQGANAAYTRVSTLLLPDGQAVRPGRYIVTYAGEGTVNYGLNAVKIDSESRPGRDVIEVKPATSPTDGPFFLNIEATDPKGTGNYIREIKVFHEEDTPLLEMGLEFTPRFLENLKFFSNLRTMDWQAINGSTETSWNQRPLETDATYMRRGVPIEDLVALANMTETELWLSIPARADEDYIRQMATYVRDNLNPNLKVRLEYSNELWNRGGIYPGQYLFEQAAIRWAPYWQSLAALPENQGKSLTQIQEEQGSWLQYGATRTAEIAETWKQIFGSRDRVQSVLGLQAVSPFFGRLGLSDKAWTDEQRRQGVPEANIKRATQLLDAIAIGPYIGVGFGDPANAPIIETWLSEPDGGFARLAEVLITGGYTDANGQRVVPFDTSASSIAGLRSAITAYKAFADELGKPLLGYEGIQSLNGYLGVENNERLMAFFNEMNRRPEMGRVYDEYLKMWNEVTGGTLFTHLSDVTRYDKWGSWGALEFWNQNSSPKYDALKNYSNTLNATGVMLSGDAGNNTLTGDTRSDTIVGAAGADTINGGDGKDYLHGGAGNDLIIGGNGNDLLLGSTGNDTLTGGQGLDYFSFTNPNEGSDTITDFLVGGNEQIRLMTGGFAGLTAAPGSDGRLATGLYGEGATRQIAAMMARVAHNFQTGAAILAVRSGSAVQIFYDPNTGISNNESLLGTLQNINLNQISISNFHLYTMGG